MSCPYANLFGEPNTGVHSIRVFGIAVVDTVLTVLAAYVIAKAYKINFWYSFLGLFVLGEILHYLFGTKTAFLKMIGLEPNCV
jgi:hypothetical protein